MPASTSPDETTGLLATAAARDQRAGRPFSLRGWATDALRPHDLTAPLLLVTLVNSLLDPAAYSRLGVYNTCMTGNLVMLALLLTGNGSPAASSLLPGTSLLAFVLGGAIFGQVGHWVGDRSRGWLVGSLIAQTALVALAAILIDTAYGEHHWLLVLLLSTAGGAQVAMAKGTGNPEISTAILTSPFIDTVGNRDLLRPFALPPARRRHLAVQWLYLGTFLSGAFVGGLLLRQVGAQTVLWTTVGLRAAAVVWVALLPGEGDEVAKPPASD